MEYILRCKQPKPPGKILTGKKQLVIHAFNRLSSVIQKSLLSIIYKRTSSIKFLQNKFGDTDLSIHVENYNELAELIGRELFDFGIETKRRRFLSANPSFMLENDQLPELDFSQIQVQVTRFLSHLNDHKSSILQSLRVYETLNTAQDELNRSIDHLANIHVNREYFKRQIGGIVVFLPLNQPLYSLVCFAIVPSLLAQHVWVRPPERMHFLFRTLLEELNTEKLFPNLKTIYLSRAEFVNKYKREANVVIFTGQSRNGFTLRKQFSRKSLFILNGAGHNPVIITDSADLQKAADNVIRVTLHNQGQDCASPSSILVHVNKYDEFLSILLEKLELIRPKVGKYDNDNTIVGPNTDPDHVIKIAKIFSNLREHFVYGGEINPISGMIHPTVFHKPLKFGPSYEEFFAPVIMLQSYQEDNELALYFETREYYRNAMYVSIFGHSTYIKTLLETGLHTPENILYETNLHEIERGFLPYGGNGPDASCIMIEEQKIPGPTLPQRDIFRFLIKPLIDRETQNGN